ncbi:MAG: ammonium transporter [Gracilibacteraceae bacterium]|jgi:Amt family ammonium transporter|nr:ammonium transporter [Gracilibacteraceae bacterium]
MDFSIWFLIGAALVFFMQSGFAMVETGFTRAKNAGNIIMKNVMDFCIGTVAFLFLGFSLMCAEDYVFGLIGVPNLDIITNYAEFDYSNFVFNLVFCATAATIVSGAMAERTKFSAYCIYSAVISAFIYPVEAGWVWNAGGWLATRGFIDFAGSAAIHMVGGISAFVGALLLGPRIGKYVLDRDGRKKSRAIPGHSITLGAIGVFILWFGWYGFNGAAAGDTAQLGSIFLTTTVAPAAATVVAMLLTWGKNGKPDVSMSLNGALAGLVGITAPCASVDAFGALVIGLVAGFLVVFAVEIIDMKLHVDDPVGAIAVHGVCGAWGAIAVGLFATEGGLFYGGGAGQLTIQVIGVVAIAAWTFAAMFIVFGLIKALHGLRVSAETEIGGLDQAEHGLISGYADFAFSVPLSGFNTGEEPFIPAAPAPAAKAQAAPVPPEQAVPVVDHAQPGAKMTKVTIVTNQTKFEKLQSALDQLGITGLTVTNVLGYGMQKGHTGLYRGVPIATKLLHKVQVDIVVCKIPTATLVKTVKEALYTGHVGDGKIFIYDVENVIKVRTGEEGFDALQDE